MNWEYIIVHHTGAEEKNADQVRRYHLSLGWREVGYNYIIERDGRLVTGRSLDQPGAHCLAGNMNRLGIGVALIGNLDLRPATPGQLQTLAALLQRLMAAHRLPPERVLGHREVPGAATACPGRLLDLAQLRRGLGAGVGAGSGAVAGASRVAAETRAAQTETKAQVAAHTAAQAQTEAQTAEAAGAQAQGTVGVQGKQTPALWRVQAGAFGSRQAAEARVQKLRRQGIDAFVVAPGDGRQ